MKKVLVLGGGLAGLSTSVFLTEQKYKITILEASPKLGGRAYSYYSKMLDLYVDYGQHLLMGCYGYTLNYLKDINSIDNLFINKKMDISFIDKNKSIFGLSSNSFVYPFNLLMAILNFRLFKLSEKILLLKLFTKLLFLRANDFGDISIEDWLTSEKQSKNLINNFWEFIAISALNSPINKTPASIFILILKEIFLQGSNASSILLPKQGLSNLLINPARKYLEEKNVEIISSDPVKELVFSDNKIIEVITNKNIYTDFDIVVSALPYYKLKQIIKINTNNFEPKKSPIISIQVKLKNNPLKENYYALVNSPIHWVFNNKTHLSLVISSASELISLSKEELSIIAQNELYNYFDINKDMISGIEIIKEKNATFVPDKNFLFERPKTETEYTNLFLAGDWVNTNLPCTIESAVKSGFMAANTIKRLF